MKLYHIQLRPCSAWITPWQADTLTGMLCWTMARMDGEAALREEFLEPALDGKPPFILSDGFPAERLPAPLTLRLREWSADQRKTVKRARWLARKTFQNVQRGQPIDVEDLLLPDAVHISDRFRNTISRVTNTTGEHSLFSCVENTLHFEPEGTTKAPCLSVYARVADGNEDRLIELFDMLSAVGYGADTSAGKGSFVREGELEPADWLEEGVVGANGVIVLSTFQPAMRDPSNGYWELFTKYGKIGPDFGMENVFKRPLIMMRPGACFQCAPNKPVLGHALPMYAFLDEDQAAGLEQRGVSLIHPAFGLTVPITIPEEEQL
jgi:CRISPR-associated protein Csm4